MRRMWLVRHGESAGNVARALAEERQLLEIEVEARDVDVALSELGERQADATGMWLARQTVRPTIILSSPYRRAHGTAERIARHLGVPLIIDERLREKELGLLNRVTRRGLEKNFPEYATLRAALGKFYFRPPSGESWCDVILRLRSFLDTLFLEHGDDDVLITTHSVVISCMRYLCEHLSEAEILAIDAQKEIKNCAITTYERRERAFTLVDFNVSDALEEMHERTTAEPKAPQAAR